jgi:type IV pilus biogenesis protein CpaD/CtpE
MNVASHLHRALKCARLAPAALLLVSAGCLDRSGVHLTPTAGWPCPPWVEFPADGHSNEDPAYLGCANAVNLEAMIDQSDDLQAGRPLGPASGERESLGVVLYNQGKIAPAKSAGSATPTIIMPAAAAEPTQ